MTQPRQRTESLPDGVPEQSRGSSLPLSTSNHRAVREVARDVLRLGNGARLPTATDYQDRLGIGAGTVQKAFVMLQQAEAITVVARGHQGRFVRDCDLGQLWALAGLPPLRLLLPPPGTVETFGLREASRDLLADQGVPLQVDHMRGAGRRLRALADGEADIAVVSRGAVQAEERLVRRHDLGFATLGSGSYYRDDTMLVLERASGRPRSPLRVAIDNESFDHRELTMAEFGQQARVELVECEFTQVPAQLLAGQIDVGVWHDMQLLVPLELMGLRSRPVAPGTMPTLARLGSASLVFRGDAREIQTLLGEVSVTELDRRQSHHIEAFRAGRSAATPWHR